MSNYRIHRFQLKAKADSLRDILLRYIKSRDGDLSEKERLLQALSAFWLLEALVESGQFSEKEIAQQTLTSILRLQQQIAHLSSVASLHAPSYSHLFITNLAEDSPRSTSNGNYHTTKHLRRKAQVNNYTEPEELEVNPPPSVEDSQEDFDQDFHFLEDTTKQIDKIFGV